MKVEKASFHLHDFSSSWYKIIKINKSSQGLRYFKVAFLFHIIYQRWVNWVIRLMDYQLSAFSKQIM